MIFCRGEASEKDISRIERDSKRVEKSVAFKTNERSKTTKELCQDIFDVTFNTSVSGDNVSHFDSISCYDFFNVSVGFNPNEISPRAGAVAQLGEHHTCTVGVAGSNPVSSTTRFQSCR